MVFKNKPLAQIALSSIELQFRLAHTRPSYLGGYIGQRLEGQHESGAGVSHVVVAEGKFCQEPRLCDLCPLERAVSTFLFSCDANFGFGRVVALACCLVPLEPGKDTEARH